MFETVQTHIDIYDKPSLSGKVVGQIGIGQDVEVQGTPVVVDGWVWHEVKGGNLWVIERSADGNALLLTMVWKGEGKPPIPAGYEDTLAPQRQMPEPPAEFTNGQLLEAFQKSAEVLGARDQVDAWLAEANLTWIKNITGEYYEGEDLRHLPFDDEIKLSIIGRLKSIVERSPAQPDGTITPAQPSGRFTMENAQFFLEGQTFRFVGVNCRELIYYGYPAWHHGKYTKVEHIETQFAEASRMRAQVVRCYAPYNRKPDGTEGNDYDDTVRRIEHVLNLAEKYNMFVLISLDDAKASGFNIAVNNAKYREPGFNSNMPYFFGGYKETYFDFVQNVVTKIAGHPNIFAFGVSNEDQINPYVPPTPTIAECEAFLNYYKDCSEAIRAAAPQHLITTSLESSHHLYVNNAYSGKNYASQMYSLPSIDFAAIHTYMDLLDGRNELGTNDARIRIELERGKNEWGKPLVIEEIGPDGGENRGGAGEWITNTVNTLFNMGVAGIMQWGFSGTTVNIGVGDTDRGMHKPGDRPGVPTHDYGAMFDAYKRWGEQFWIGDRITE